MLIRLATWNVHGCVGSDGRHAPERTTLVLRTLQADIISLQEVRFRHVNGPLLEDCVRALSYQMIKGPCNEFENNFGNALLTRFPVRNFNQLDLSVGGRDPRGLLEVELQVGTTLIRAVVTHFGLRVRERRKHVIALLRKLPPASDLPLVLFGDINEWRPGAKTFDELNRILGTPARPLTYPAWFPILPLDRVWIYPRGQLRSLQVHKSWNARMASDHLPVLATMGELDAGDELTRAANSVEGSRNAASDSAHSTTGKGGSAC